MNKPLRVLHVIDSLGLGGAQTVLRGYFEQMKDNPDIFLFALRRNPPEIHIEHPNVYVFDSSRKYSLAPLRALRRFVTDNRIDILHCHLIRSGISGSLIKMLFVRSLKLVFQKQGDIFGELKGIDNFIYHTGLWFSKFAVNAYIAVSEHHREASVRLAHIPERKIRVIHNFVDLKRFAPATIYPKAAMRAAYGIPDGCFVFGLAGRIVQRKGWIEFVEAVRRVVGKEPHARFVIAGTGSDEEALRARINAYALGEKVAYIGYVSDMLRFYSLVDCVVIPSHFEGLPLTQLEAMAVGKPLISSDGPGLTEVGEDRRHLLYFPNRDSSALAEKMIEVMNNEPLRLHVVGNAFVRVRDFSINQFISTLNALYQSL